MGSGIDPRTPCVIGVAQQTWHLGGHEASPEPLAMAAEVVRAATTDTEATGDVLGAIDSLQAVYCMSWPYDDLPRRLAERLAIDPRLRRYSGIGGTVPQQLLSEAATEIRAGALDVAVVCGAEALDTVRRLRKAGERPAWSHRHRDKQPMPFEAPFHPAEVAHEVFQAWLTFALRDVARRAHRGDAPDAYRGQLGDVLAPLTDAAASNPYAWFPKSRSAAELITPTADNRMVGYPYTKHMVAIMDVDMAAAVVLSSEAAADGLGVPVERRVYLRGWGQATDPTYVAEHPDLWRSPAMTTAFADALAGARVGVDDVAHLDLYSCFASSLLFAVDALGIDPASDHRPLTVTGGLPYAGGPASNYMAHAVAAVVERLRADPGSIGLVSGVGMHMTKHVAAVYSTTPGSGPTAPPAPSERAASEPVPMPISDRYEGAAVIAAYSVVHGRDGDPQWGLVVADVDEGRSRIYARVEDATMLEAMEEDEVVGTTVTVATGPDAVNRVTSAV